MSDQDLVSGLRRGDGGAWDEFHARFADTIRAVVGWGKWRFAPEVCEELRQTIHGDLAKAFAQGTEVGSLVRFVRTVCVRRCIDEVRRQIRSRERFVPIELEDDAGVVHERLVPAGPEFDPVREIALHERAQNLRLLMARMDPTCSMAIRRFYVDNRSYRDMADELGITVNTVGSRLAKCLNKLREMIGTDPFLREDLAPLGD